MAAMIEYTDALPARYAELGWIDMPCNADWLVAAQVVYTAQKRPSEDKPWPGPSDCIVMYWPPYPWVALQEAEKIFG